MAATAAEDKRICVWDLGSASLVGWREARATSALAVHELRIPGEAEPQMLVFWGDRVGNVGCARASDPSGPERILLGHTGSALVAVAVVNDGTAIVTADNDETVRISALPFGHRIIGHAMGHAGSLQQALPLAGGAGLITVGTDGTARLSSLAAGSAGARIGEVVVLPGAPPPALEFAGGRLEDTSAGEADAVPSRADAVAAAAAGVAVPIGRPDPALPAEATAAGLAPVSPVEAVPTADGTAVRCRRAAIAKESRIGLYDGGFVCSSAVQSPVNGDVVLVVTSLPEDEAAAEAAARQLERARACTTAARGKRPRPGSDGTEAVRGTPRLDLLRAGPSGLSRSALAWAPARWADAAFAADGTLLLTTSAGRVDALAVGSDGAGPAAAGSPGAAMASSLNEVLAAAGPSSDEEQASLSAIEAGAAFWRSG